MSSDPTTFSPDAQALMSVMALALVLGMVIGICLIIWILVQQRTINRAFEHVVDIANGTISIRGTDMKITPLPNSGAGSAADPCASVAPGRDDQPFHEVKNGGHGPQQKAPQSGNRAGKATPHRPENGPEIDAGNAPKAEHEKREAGRDE